MENKAAVPLVHDFLFAEMTMDAVFSWEYDASRKHTPNNQQDQAHQGWLSLLKALDGGQPHISGIRLYMYGAAR